MIEPSTLFLSFTRVQLRKFEWLVRLNFKGKLAGVLPSFKEEMTSLKGKLSSKADGVKGYLNS